MEILRSYLAKIKDEGLEKNGKESAEPVERPVKADIDDYQFPGNTGQGRGCFGGESLVETTTGEKYISDLELGDKIRTSQGQITYFTKFLGWMDRSSSKEVRMLKIQTSDGASVTLTGSHIMFSNSTPMYASQLQPGDTLRYWNGSYMKESEIIEISRKYSSPWAPLTSEGTLLVDGLLASCYASYPHELADLALAPVKLLPGFLLDDEKTQHIDGTRTFIKMMKQVGDMFGARQVIKVNQERRLDLPFNSMLADIIIPRTTEL